MSDDEKDTPEETPESDEKDATSEEEEKKETSTSEDEDEETDVPTDEEEPQKASGTDDADEDDEKSSPEEEETPPEKKSGDLRVWQQKYEQAEGFIESGNIYRARQLLEALAEEAPFEEIRKDSREKLKQFRPDWPAWIVFGGTVLVLAWIVFKYVF